MNRIATTPKATKQPIEAPKAPSYDRIAATYNSIISDSASGSKGSSEHLSDATRDGASGLRPGSSGDYVKNWRVPAGGE